VVQPSSSKVLLLRWEEVLCQGKQA
jgi:hypothetical protein